MKTKFQTLIIEFLDYLESEKGFSEHTIQSYKLDLKVFFDYCTDLDSKLELNLNKIKPVTIIGFLSNEMGKTNVSKKGAKPYSEKTIARRLASIKALFKYLYNFEMIKDNPTIYIKTPKSSKLLPSFVKEDDISKLMEEPLNNIITNESEAYRDLAILETLYATGLRLAELVSLNICDVDYTSEMVKVMGKGGKERIVPIGTIALNSINTYLKNTGRSLRADFNDPLFTNKKGARLPKRTLQRRVKKYLETTMGGGSVHTLRHTFATHLIDRGADMLTVKELLGHSSLSSTQHYTQLNLETIKKVYQKNHPRGE
jgi:site-specific recombinase XerD